MAISNHSDTHMMWSHVLMMNILAKTHISQLPEASGKLGFAHLNGHGPNARLATLSVPGCQAIQGVMRASEHGCQRSNLPWAFTSLKCHCWSCHTFWALRTIQWQRRLFIESLQEASTGKHSAGGQPCKSRGPQERFSSCCQITMKEGSHRGGWSPEDGFLHRF